MVSLKTSQTRSGLCYLEEERDIERDLEPSNSDRRRENGMGKTVRLVAALWGRKKQTAKVYW